ncbi:hypothetical protein PINS_up004707 [Pythium insidiosum]|nr:hypothetical protein PINS_up004707 [Pythium insidiosum]
MNSVELVDAVEQVVRLYLGDEGHLQTATGTNLRRKNSVRAMGLATQSGAHSVVAPDARSPEEKVRFNVRVSTSPQRQMNPYVSGENPERELLSHHHPLHQHHGYNHQSIDEDNEEEDDDDDEEDGNDERERHDDDVRARHSGRRTPAGNWRTSPRRRGGAAAADGGAGASAVSVEGTSAEDAVTKRSDIKNRSRLELERKRTPHRRSERDKQAGDKTATTKDKALLRR